MSTPRYGHAAALRPDGKVVVAAGANDTSGCLTSVEIYDPMTDTWSPGPALSHLTGDYIATTALVLGNGSILVARQTGPAGIEIEALGPTAIEWTVEPTMPYPGAYLSMLPLPSGRILVGIGFADMSSTEPQMGEIFDPATGRWLLTPQLPRALSFPSITALADGRVLLAGGIALLELGTMPTYGGAADTDVFDETLGAWTPGSNMLRPRMGFLLAPTPDGAIAIAGMEGISCVTTTGQVLSFEDDYPPTSRYFLVP
jgi:hypothetical protein